MTRVLLAYAFDESPQGAASPAFFVIAGVVLLLAAALTAYLLLAPRRQASDPVISRLRPRADEGDPALWHERVAQILRRYEGREITDEQAYLDLATVSRGYASVRLGQDASSATLTDLRSADVPPRHRDGMQALRQTVTALYPPEFADPVSNENARRATVPDACRWVDSLIERWR